MTQYGLSSSEHDQIDVEGYYSRIYSSIQDFQGKTIIDLFSGAGRDIAQMYSALQGQGNFVAIDSESQRLVDMVSKNFASAAEHGVQFEIVNSQAALDAALGSNKIAAIQGKFPATPLGNHGGKSDIDIQADFILCNAGIMFVQPEDLAPTLAKMASMVKESGELAVRFSLARDDKAAQLGKSYFVHDPVTVMDILEHNGMSVHRHPDLSDPNDRPFKWVDIQALK